MTLEQERLVLDNMEIVRRVAGAFISKTPLHIDRESVRSAAYEGLVRAVLKFDGRETWPGYCHQKVIGAMLDETRRQDPAKNRSNVKRVEIAQVPLYGAEGLSEARDWFQQALDCRELLDALETLTERERYIVVATEILDRQGRDLAVELGISESWVSRMRNEAFVKLREQLK